MPEGLKIETKTGQILYDSVWIAGVDYQEEDNDKHNAPIEGTQTSRTTRQRAHLVESCDLCGACHHLSTVVLDQNGEPVDPPGPPRTIPIVPVQYEVAAVLIAAQRYPSVRRRLARDARIV